MTTQYSCSRPAKISGSQTFLDICRHIYWATSFEALTDISNGCVTDRGGPFCFGVDSVCCSMDFGPKWENQYIDDTIIPLRN